MVGLCCFSRSCTCLWWLCWAHIAISRRGYASLQRLIFNILSGQNGRDCLGPQFHSSPLVVAGSRRPVFQSISREVKQKKKKQMKEEEKRRIMHHWNTAAEDARHQGGGSPGSFFSSFRRKQQHTKMDGPYLSERGCQNLFPLLPSRFLSLGHVCFLFLIGIYSFSDHL